MRRLLSRFAVGGMVLLGAFISYSTGVVAQTNSSSDVPVSSITLSPAASRPTFDAGSVQADTVKVINSGQQEYTFVVYAGPYSVRGEDYNPDFTTINKSNQAYQWIQFEKTSYSIKPGQTIEVPYKIIIPEDATPGGHYAVIFAETQPPESSKASVERKKRVGSLMYMTVNGEMKMAGRVEGWDLRFWQRQAPLLVDVRVRNDGNAHFTANTHVVFRDIFGKDKLTYNQESIIMPGTTRRIPIKWDKPPIFGLFKVGGDVKLLDHSEKLPQRYVLYTPVWLNYIIGGVILVFCIRAVARRLRPKRGKDAKKKKTDDKD